ncbi:hypothetical protein O6H91_05G018300 [Diphasiastrum complanatum]|uniref:Uncharacterized protein n=4 Tax=Diphasiastrum complanatum TaxID=34168 RepID=A0ACC2DL15_DIPCM|nr:hypothetical protein O6H91_05G018300 [Diphasiastrum complanatum]KAJ7554986.1 hypothetical protein O6H91_05G018300 [Diphasiastrum complanatum]KAJ7554987.1 hypothetical protein O6H91_05G018300 [Diphasiastrum complanatum]KAJ7554988.1 hypothetical protein O6H91_05G018300 [Diphasiastrum complanatum]
MEVDEKQQTPLPFTGEAQLSPLVSQIVAPGDIVLDLTTVSKTLRLGSGLRQDGGSITVMKAGRLRYSKPNKLWVEGSQRRYIPNIEDVVIGIVVDRRFENFTIDINAPTYGILPVLAFEGATRRNIPNIQVGAAIYTRVVKAHRDINPELCCTDASGKSSGYGPLKGGYIFDCSTGLARALLSRPTCPVLEALGKSLSFEIAVGLNGKVWVNGSTPETIILVSNAITNAEFLTPAQQHIMVQKLLQNIQ